MSATWPNIWKRFRRYSIELPKKTKGQGRRDSNRGSQKVTSKSNNKDQDKPKKNRKNKKQPFYKSVAKKGKGKGGRNKKRWPVWVKGKKMAI